MVDLVRRSRVVSVVLYSNCASWELVWSDRQQRTRAPAVSRSSPCLLLGTCAETTISTYGANPAVRERRRGELIGRLSIASLRRALAVLTVICCLCHAGLSPTFASCQPRVCELMRSPISICCLVMIGQVGASRTSVEKQYSSFCPWSGNMRSFADSK